MQKLWATGVLWLGVAGWVVAGPEKPRVFVMESNSWQMNGGLGMSNDVRGASPQTAEIIKTFRERCPSVAITREKDKADYTVTLEHEGGKGLVRRDNKVVVFDKEGDVVFSHSTRSLGNAVKDSCKAIEQHLSRR